MKQRIITGILAFSALIIVICVGKWALFATVLLVNFLSLYEYISTVYHEKKLFDIIFVTIIGSILIFAGVYMPHKLLIVLMAGILLVFVRDILSRKHHDTDKTIYKIWGLIYISFILSLATVVLFGENGIYLFVMTIIACIACDTCAYFIGIKFGKHKLSPEISPKKSIEGSIAGFFGAIIITIIAYFCMEIFHVESISFQFMIIAGVVIGIMAQFGDLSASMIKRKFEVKDYSNILPGHGGILDRIDSILFAIASVYILLHLF